jgi:diguanylate cyclase (GGDEF)-like protein/PAS domain S-box-containing protein
MPYDASPENPVYQTLLESTRAIPWKIDWKTMTFAYIGPQIEELLGWSQASWVSANDWADRMHAEDRERVVNFCISQSREGTDHEADYRALTTTGDYVWIRDVVHVVRDDNGEVESLVGFMFDISERKRAEEQLIMLQRQLEEYSYKDGLTGVANRRMFDSVLDTEWGSAQRSGQPLSLVLLDIDYFKQFNDTYGHIRGDDCLRIVGKALAFALHRPRDFIARFGGEEFVLVLPETDSEAAQQIAERCRDALREQRIAHEKSGVSDLLTISLGVGTAVPAAMDRPLDFVAAVDRLLYQAKQAGRDRLVAAQWNRGDDLRRDAVR